MDDSTLAALSWRKDILAAAVPPLILGILAFAFLPESAVYLEATGRHDDAQDSVAFYERSRYHIGCSVWSCFGVLLSS